MDANAKRVAKETAKVLRDYLTYQAVRTIVMQLSETNPPQAIWLRRFVRESNVQDSESYLQQLMLERKDLVLRILTVRESLAETVLEFVPEMVLTGIKEDNLAKRCQLLERLTQSGADASELPRETDSEEPPAE